MPHINQNDLENKLSLFLTTLGDEDLSQFAEGLCNAFVFVNLRADIIDQQDHNIARMEAFMQLNDNAIIEMAKTYNEYRKARRSLIEMKEGTDALPTFNQHLNSLQNQLTNLRHENPRQEAQIQMFENQIRELRDQRNQLVEQILRNQFSKQFNLINHAREIYIYIHTLVGAAKPGANLNFRIHGKVVTQNDFHEILQLLPPDNVSHEKLPVEKVFEIVFNFTKEELIALLDNKLGPNTICNGDYIAIGSNAHVMYLSKKNGEYILYDPGPVKIKPNNAKTLVTTLKNNFDIHSNYLSIAVSIFEKSGGKSERAERPNPDELIKQMLSKRTNKNINAKSDEDITAVWMAAKYGLAGITQLLIQHGADVNIPDKDGATPTYVAAGDGHVAVIEELKKGGADFNIPTKEGATPTYLAAYYGHATAVEALAKGNANLNALFNGKTPAYIAARRGHADVIEVLAKFKAQLNTPNLLGDTPAHAAVQEGHTAVIEALIKGNADLNATNKEGQTPLHVAIKKSHFACILLLSSKTNLYIKDKHGKMPIQYASRDVRAFLTLHIVKSYIETHQWQIQCPQVAIDQLNRIKNNKDNWESALKDVIDMATKSVNPSSLFAAKDLEIQNYLNAFSDPNKVSENIMKLALDENASLRTTVKRKHSDLS